MLRRPDFLRLLDQLEPTIEHSRGSRGVLNVLSLRLLALDRQRAHLGQPATCIRHADIPEVPEQVTPLVMPEAPVSETSSVSDTEQTAVPRKLPTNKWQSWLCRRHQP